MARADWLRLDGIGTSHNVTHKEKNDEREKQKIGGPPTSFAQFCILCPSMQDAKPCKTDVVRKLAVARRAWRHRGTACKQVVVLASLHQETKGCDLNLETEGWGPRRGMLQAFKPGSRVELRIASPFDARGNAATPGKAPPGNAAANLARALATRQSQSGKRKCC